MTIREIYQPYCRPWRFIVQTFVYFLSDSINMNIETRLVELYLDHRYEIIILPWLNHGLISLAFCLNLHKIERSFKFYSFSCI